MRRGFWLGLLAALLLARALRALLSTSFYASLATLRLNESAFWLVVLLAPALARFAPTRPTILVAGLASAALPLARFGPWYTPVAALAVAAGLAALPRIPASGVLVGFALDAAILVAGGSHDPTLATWGVAAAALLALVAWRMGDVEPPPRRALDGVAFGALLAVEVAFLANPFGLARWAGAPLWAAALASLGSFALGAARPMGRWVFPLAALGAIDLAFVRSPFVVLSIGLLQLGLGSAGGRLAPAGWSLALVFAPVTFLLLYFPSPLGESEWQTIVPLLALVALALAFPHPRRRGPQIAPSERGRRAVAPGLAVAALVLLAAIPNALAPAPEGRTFTAVTWNVHQAFGNRGGLDPEIYRDVLRDLDPDVVFLQEADTTQLSSGGVDIVRYLADALGMRAAYGRGGPAILTKFPIVGPARDDQWHYETQILVDDDPVWLQSIHFARRQAERIEQAAQIRDAPGAPRIVAGDFNLFAGLAGNPPYDTLVARYDDAWVEAGHARDDPAGATLSAARPRWRIDLVLVDGVDVLEAERLRDERTRLASDHLPVKVVLRLPER